MHLEFVTLILCLAVLCLAGFGNLPGDMVCHVRGSCFLLLPLLRRTKYPVSAPGVAILGGMGRMWSDPSVFFV